MTSLSLSAATRIVNPRANDAYRTIQAAVDAAEPGDVVEIESGVYHERVHIRNGGTARRPVVVQAAPNGFVLINAGTPLEPEWTATPGLPEVFSAAVAEPLLTLDSGLWEMPSRLRLAQVQSPEQVAARLGSWYYDAPAGRLYLRGSGRAPVPELKFWIEDPKEPAVKITAPHVEIHHLQATLGQDGFLITGKEADHVTVQNCRAFCNARGGIQITGDGHRILRNETFENNGFGIRLLYGVNYGLIRDNLCYHNGPNNGEPTDSLVDLGIHGLGDFNVFEGNIVDGLHEDAFRNKTARRRNPTTTIRHNVIRGNQTPSSGAVYGNTLLVNGLGMRLGMYRNGGQPGPMRSWENVDPDGLQRALNLIHPLVQKEDPHFADPAYRDYRLQADSPWLGRGAHPGLSPVLYVDPLNGKEGNTGLSLSAPLPTPEAALQRLPAGGTLYLLPGKYAQPIILTNGGISPGEPLQIRAYGKQEGVVIAGGLEIRAGGLENKGRSFFELDGLEFQSPLTLNQSTGVRVRHCVFSGEEAGIKAVESPRLWVDRCTFSGNRTALALENSPRACVVQNVFTGCRTLVHGDDKTCFSAFNVFDSADATLGGRRETITLGPDFAVPANGPLAMAAADFGFVGARQENAASQWEVKDLRVAGSSPHGATLLWETPRQATFAEITLEGGGQTKTWQPEYWLQILGSSFDITRLMDLFYASQRHAVLPDLQPDTAYTVTLVPIDRKGRRGPARHLRFRTPDHYSQAVTRYISPEGSDRADGRSARTPWRTFAHATARLAPGDELVLLPGIYHESLRPRVSGTPERPITIRAAESQKSVLDLSMGTQIAVEILNTDHLVIDGLLISGGTFPRSYCFIVNHAREITLRNCEVDWPDGADFEKLKLGYLGVVAHAAPGLRVENNLFLTCVVGVAASHSPGAVISHNTIVGEGNYGVVLLPASAEDRYTVENNLFYRTTLGYKINPAIWVFDPMPRLTCDYNLFYIPKDHKATIGKLPGTERLFPLAAWTEATGLDRHSVQVEPTFTNPAARDFSLRSGSPGNGAARDGGVVGRRW